MIDVDDFKSYNDFYGHLQGDGVLKDVGRILQENLREVDMACRYAGDEFVAILPETNLMEAEVVAQKIREKMKNLDLKRKVTLSIGIANGLGCESRYDLILKADTALYTAKKTGKNQICMLE